MPEPSRRRPPPPAWTRPLTERLTPTVTALVIAVTLVYFFFVLAEGAREAMVAHLCLGPLLYRGEVWQLVTSVFVHVRPAGWFFTIIGLWWVGAFVERTRGQRFFVGLFIGAGVAANVAAGLVGLAIPGALSVRSDGSAYALTALFVAFARIYGPRPAQIWGALQMRADYFTWIIIGFSLLVALVNRDWVGIVSELAAIGVAFAATGGIATFRQKLGGGGGGGRGGRPRPRYQVLDGGKRRPTDLN